MSDASIALSDHLGEPIEFVCPRCQRNANELFYGPCSTCRTTLRAVMDAEAKVVEKTDYEPKMNVTPNAVATKD
ncbi:MAG TPA: hypothetical protein PLS63_04810 [Microthrixaceae bacterium]|jgi:hypothetical protein|nr:hypothetical protein [Microthrixaceae bacterium]